MDETRLKELMEQAMAKLLGGDVKAFTDTINEIKGWGADNGRLKQAEDAVKQLEASQKELMSTIDQKLQAAARRAYDANGHYRGSFANESQARTFGLLVVSLTASSGDSPGLAKRAAEILESDHKDFVDRRKDLDGDDSVIPHEHSTRIHRLVEDYGVFPRRAFEMPMGSETLSFTRRVSGFRARKTKVRKVVEKQDMAVAPVNLTADDWDILTSYPKTLEADAFVAIAELFVVEMGLGFAIALDEDAFIGDGSDLYDNEMGIITLLKQINGVDDGGGLILGNGATGDGWDSLTKDDVFKMVGRARYTRPGQSALYGSNEFFWTVLAKIITDGGGRTVMESQNGIQLNFFGIPYEIVNVMPRTPGNSQVPLLYGDVYQSSTIGNRQRMTIDTSKEAYWTSKEIGVMASGRYAMNHHSLGDETTAGPVVGLVTPAAA